MWRVALALTLVVSLSAFRSTDVQVYTYPTFENYRFDTVFLQIPTDNKYFQDYVTERISKEFRKRNIKTYTPGEIFSPFRSWSDEEKAAVLAELGVDATIIISLESADRRIGSGVTFYDYNPDLGFGSAYSVKAMKEQAVFHVRLIDAGSQDLVWAGILHTRGNGTLFVGDKSTAKAVSKHVVKSLNSSGHLPK